MTDTFTIDHLLRKLNSENVRVLSCVSPIDGAGSPYFQKYLKKLHICEKNILCIRIFCCRKLSQSNEKDYLLIKSNGPTTFLVNGEEQTKVGPQYVHFNKKCLKEYLHRKHNVQVEEFPYERNIIDRETLNRLTDEECA